MASKTKTQRKTVAFDQSEFDQQLLGAIATELQTSQFKSFGELCKAALNQYLLNREPTQPLVLLMELQHQLTILQSRVERLETQGQSGILGSLASLEEQSLSLNKSLMPVNGNGLPLFRVGAQSSAMTSDSQVAQPEAGAAPKETQKDPLLEHLGTLLDDF